MNAKPGVQDEIERRRELNRQLRLAYVARAEERSRGRGLTDAELKRIIARYPGGLPEG